MCFRKPLQWTEYIKCRNTGFENLLIDIMWLIHKNSIPFRKIEGSAYYTTCMLGAVGQYNITENYSKPKLVFTYVGIEVGKKSIGNFCYRDNILETTKSEGRYNLINICTRKNKSSARNN